MTTPALLPDYTTPADLAAHFGVSERVMREKVREFQTYTKIGRKVVLFPEHVEAFEEALKCHSSSTAEAKSGTTGAPLPEGDYAALQAQRTKKPQGGSRRKSKQTHGAVISMDRGRT
ncbi:hypothetical protein [Shimia sediminis]|uniref:hypothetical protein n=1 Tax=Shimia sediminis TaxID=2497945 RepID=UPI001F413ACF|nr:hypothetical protein [Shimia sediminis]